MAMAMKICSIAGLVFGIGKLQSTSENNKWDCQALGIAPGTHRARWKHFALDPWGPLRWETLGPGPIGACDPLDAFSLDWASDPLGTVFAQSFNLFSLLSHLAKIALCALACLLITLLRLR